MIYGNMIVTKIRGCELAHIVGQGMVQAVKVAGEDVAAGLTQCGKASMLDITRAGDGSRVCIECAKAAQDWGWV